MSSTPMPWIIPQYFVSVGGLAVMASNYQLFSYLENSTTKQDTFADSALTTVNDNPIVLDEFGRAPIFLALANYKFVLATPTAADPPDPSDIVWTEDFVPAYGTLFSNFDITGIAGEETTNSQNVVYLSDGSEGAGHVAGFWYLTNALTDYASSKAIAIGVAVAPILTGETGTIRVAGRAEGMNTTGSLTIGAIYYLSDSGGGQVTSTPPAQNVVILGRADSISTMIIEPNLGNASTLLPGIVGLEAQSIAGEKTFDSQAVSYIGGAVTLPVNLGGVFFTDTTSHALPQNSTQAVLSSFTVPGNMLDANGKSIQIEMGGTVAWAGASSKVIYLHIGGAFVSIWSAASNIAPYWFTIIITRASATTYTYLATFSQTVVAIKGTYLFAVGTLDYTNDFVIETAADTGVGDTLTQDFLIARSLS